ncbi:MAG: TetR/AcrR family transcriptional regulator [Pseudomonas sp.]|uniref:TetR/AcrR family transcriptional regulator n=1 Tax=Pseudomonas sp. TaxID=306 RepID=UPI0011FD25DC|nr:TetR/AcrR family transcriptional regulator [Pseudomonas sp.]RZI76921.1 MAG: TetR/AcrR family transcriptional regulator [Pseudomonas sp.]
MTPTKAGPAAARESDSDSQTLSDTQSHRLDRTSASRITDPRHVRSASALRDALLRLIEHKALDDITVREIVSEAGVNNATFFRHHADKKSFFDRIATEEIDRLVAVSLPFGHSLDGYIVLCEYVRRNRTLWTALLTGGVGAVMRERYIRVSREVASKYAGVKSWLPHDLSVICSTALIVETLSWWLSLPLDTHSPTEIAEILDNLVSGTVARSSPERATRTRKSARST